MAAIGRDAAVEAAIAAIDGVVRVEAAIAVAGLPGVRAARVGVLLAEGWADAAGAVGRAALAALRAAHGPAVTGSIAVGQLIGSVRAAIPPREVIAAAGLTDAVVAADEVLFSARTRVEGAA